LERSKYQFERFSSVCATPEGTKKPEGKSLPSGSKMTAGTEKVSE